ncbi:UNVERIFIED_CONTAM: putative CCDC90 family protein C3H1.08c, mitochondrial [Sesamum calycinum]|uniref:CCDC90 family protein C3H1.08c, mitochondrial n=1 Tax=Sesamum calycinum TaxID=2727403 RepID=A0AAW2PNS4_9LAMI
MGACKRMIQLGVNSGIRLFKLRGINAASNITTLQHVGASGYSYSSLSSNSSGYKLDYRQISQLVKPAGKRVYLVDTLALESRSARHSFKACRAITSAMTLVLDDSLENISQNLISKAEMEKIELAQEANLSKFKSEVQSSQEHHFSLLQREAEKLRTDIEKMRYEIDKVTAGQRLDLNLERGRIRDELTNQSAETTNLTNKLDREIHALRAHLEAAKFDVIKYCIGTLVSISAVGIGVIRIFTAKH